MSIPRRREFERQNRSENLVTVVSFYSNSNDFTFDEEIPPIISILGMENKLMKFIKSLNNLWCKKSGAIIMLVALIISIIFFILWSVNHIPTLLFSVFMVIGISPILSICIYQKFVGRMVRVKNVFNRFNAECKYCTFVRPVFQ